MPIYKCPRCEGTESFVRTETVLRAGRTNAVNTTKIHNVEISVNICKKCGEKMQTVLTDYDKKLGAIQGLQAARQYWILGYIICFALAAYVFIFSLNMMYKSFSGDSDGLEIYEIGIALGISILLLYFGFLLRKPATRLKNQIQEEKNALRQ